VSLLWIPLLTFQPPEREKKRELMYRFDIFLGVSYEGVEEEVLEFSTIESSRKGYKRTLGAIK
jgi:hypothetical protein